MYFWYDISTLPRNGSAIVAEVPISHVSFYFLSTKMPPEKMDTEQRFIFRGGQYIETVRLGESRPAIDKIIYIM